MRLKRLAPLMTLCALSSSLMSCGLLAPKPEPCDCGVAEKETRQYMLQWGDAMEDNGNLRQRLKACEEKR